MAEEDRSKYSGWPVPNVAPKPKPAPVAAAPEPAPVVADPNEDVEGALVRRAKELGITVHPRWSINKLRSMVERAEKDDD